MQPRAPHTKTSHIQGRALMTRAFRFVLLACLLIAPVVLSAGAAARPTPSAVGPSSDAAVPGGTLRVLVASEPRSLNQDVDSNSASSAIRNLVIEYLIENNPVDHKPSYNGLVTGWKQVGPLDWRFKVRTMRFGNGEIFDARTAAWDIRYSVSRRAGFTGAYLGLITSANALGPKTMKVTTKIPVPYLPAVLTLVQAMPKAHLAKVGAAELGRAPVGTGPFLFKEWVPGRSITLVRNPRYYKKPPVVGAVTFEWVRDATTRANLLRTGAADVANDLAPNATAGPSVRIFQAPSELIIVIELNIHVPPFNDVRLRRAVAHAINRQALVNAVFGPNGATVYRNVFNPMFKSAGGHGKAYIPYDPDAARALIRQVGDVPAIDFYWPIGRYVKDNEVGVVVTGMLEAAGFKVNQHPMESGAWGVLMQSDKMPGLHIIGGAVAFANEAGSLDSKYKRTSVITYCADGLTDAPANRASQMPPGPERDALYRRIEKRLLVDLVCPVPMYIQNAVYGVSTRFQGFKAYGNPIQIFNSLRTLTLGR